MSSKGKFFFKNTEEKKMTLMLVTNAVGDRWNHLYATGVIKVYVISNIA